MKNIFKTISVLTLVIFTSIACDKDFTSIESDIEGIENFEATNEKFPVVAYTKELNPVQTNGMSSNLLGVYQDAFGTTTANVVSQVAPLTFDPDFGTLAAVDSVILSIPYFSELTETDTDGNSTYELDSIYGDTPIKLSIYRNNYFLRDTDTDTELGLAQNYYSSNPNIDFDSQTGELLYETSASSTTNPHFVPSANEIILTELDEDSGEVEISERLSPRFRVSLDNTTWQQIILDKEGDAVLSNQNNFENYFRGLYFKTEIVDPSGNGNATLLDFSQGNITIYYSNNNSDDEISTATEYTLAFTENRVNLFNNDFSIPTGDTVNGDDRLNIKGMQGSMAVIDLFNGLKEDVDQDGNTTQVDAFDYFVNKYKSDTEDGENKRLINEVDLVFHVDQDAVNGSEPERVLIYDLKNNTPIIDYYFDPSSTTTDPLNSKIVHSVRLERDDEENGTKYKIRLTEHLNNILVNDSTNVKLGLFVTSNINIIQSASLKDTSAETDVVRAVPTSSILTPKSTVLYGGSNNPNVPEDKRLELEIYYTEPQN